MLALLSVVTALALPHTGVLVPGKSLAGVRLGDTRSAVVARLGSNFGACRDCREATLYWTYKPFEPQGLGVAFRRGRVVAVFTTWSPAGWRTMRGVAVGDDEARVTEVYGTFTVTHCVGYDALTKPSRAAVTAFDTSGGLVYGFALMRPSESVCR